ncbi:YtcA family lipoprotein, partial [Escherichia fergusonii]|uniref:YtcA family lipoprotein n=1 Tax=Escherichia fergusonii TaxID=564 RepID=UPI002FF4A529
DRNRSHWSTSKTPSYTKSVSWQHHRLFCLIAGVVLTLITRQIILRTYNNLSCAGLVYTALFALYSTLFWLVFF